LRGKAVLWLHQMNPLDATNPFQPVYRAALCLCVFAWLKTCLFEHPGC